MIMIGLKRHGATTARLLVTAVFRCFICSCLCFYMAVLKTLLSCVISCVFPPGQKSNGNSFLVPRWGGFYIHNVNTTSDTLPIKHDMDMGPILTELLPQMKSLLGFSQTTVCYVIPHIYS